MKLLQVILGVTGFAPQASNPPQPFLPHDHPASIQFTAWLSAFNTGDRATISAYHTNLAFPHSVPLWGIGFPGASDVDREIDFARMIGSFDVVKIESIDEPSFVVVVVKERTHHSHHFRVNMSVDVSRPTYPATKFSLRPIVIPLDLVPEDDPRRADYENAMKPLTAERRRAVVDGFLKVVHEQYVNPNVGVAIKDTLEAKIDNGEYDSIEDNEEFAHRLSYDLRIHAKHMFINFFEPRPELNHSQAGPTPQKRLEQLRNMNFGFGNTSFDIESYPGHIIATLPINGFVPMDNRYQTDSEEIRAAVGDIMSGVADADALIIDLRNFWGGDPNTVAFIESYLLDNGPLHMLDMVGQNGTIQKSFSTIHIDELPTGSKRFGGAKPLFVLTSNSTIIAGEELVYSLQAFNRVEAIIGEGNDATPGVASTISHTSFIAEDVFGERWWFVGVPTLKPVHAISGSNWEGVGVKSDVVAGKGEWVGEKDAKKVATKLAVQSLQWDKEL